MFISPVLGTIVSTLLGVFSAWLWDRAIRRYNEKVSLPVIQRLRRRTKNFPLAVLGAMLLYLAISYPVAYAYFDVTERAIRSVGLPVPPYDRGCNYALVFFLFFDGNNRMKRGFKAGKNRYAKLVESWNERVRIQLPPVRQPVPVGSWG